jgi:digeranylgeranylglycerophospholipid reductase
MKAKTKVGIVGCGINGAYLAWKLSEKHDVEVFERNNTVGEKPCSELVSERLWKFVPRMHEMVVSEISHMIIHFPKKDVKIKFFPKMIVIDRRALARCLVEMAKKNGVVFNLNCDVKKAFYFRGKKPQISVGGRAHEFDYLIGCDGYNSVVRKSLGIKDPKCVLGLYTRIKKKPKSNVIEVWPSRNGISWMIPRKDDVEYGVFDRLELAKNEFDAFCKRMKIKPTKIEGQLIPSRFTRMQKGRVALSGDAIGLTKPWSYGGIIWGLMADNMLIKTFPRFSVYEEKVHKYFEPKIFYSKIAMFAAKFFGGKISFLTPKEVWFDGDFEF